MNQELAPFVEGVVVINTAPYETPQEARRAMSAALLALKEGADLLEEVKTRLAWKVLGFESWDDCLAASVADMFNIRIDQAQRLPLVVSLRLQELPTMEIAERTGVHPSTVTRDLNAARRVGLLEDEPDAVTARDGKKYPTRESEPVQQQRAKRPRADLGKTWRNNVVELGRRVRAMETLRDDDRYRSRAADLAEVTRHEIAQAHQFLGEILEDFTTLGGDSHGNA